MVSTPSVGPQQLADRMAHLEPVAMRLEVKEGNHGCTLINDSYNSDINSLDIALDFMNRRPDHKGRRRTLILSDIYQTGEPLDHLYKEVSNLCVQRGVNKIIGIGQQIIENRLKLLQVRLHHKRLRDVDRNHYALVL